VSAGVYELRHVPSGRFYVGSSMRIEERERDWWQRLGRIVGGLPERSVSRVFYRFAAGTRVEEWKFCVVARFSAGCSRLDVVRVEFDHIERGLKDPLCLNVTFARGSA
jgi:hypothetical protein